VIDVLIIEDDLPGAEALAGYIDRLPGFAFVGHARTGADGLHRVAAGHVDLIMLDIYLPDITGLEVLRRLRGGGNTVDVIAVTRARDLAVVQAAVSYGVAQYLVKPFTFQGVRRRLERYEAYRARRLDQGLLLAQPDIDRLLGGLRAADAGGGLPKLISRESLQAVVATLTVQGEARGVSAAELARVVGTSRVTARRYLEYLLDAGLVGREARYGEAGRPELEYTWLGDRHAAPSDPAPHPGLR
jgi:response regulator of citrate/malate metabolism